MALYIFFHFWSCWAFKNWVHDFPN